MTNLVCTIVGALGSVALLCGCASHPNYNMPDAANLSRAAGQESAARVQASTAVSSVNEASRDTPGATSAYKPIMEAKSLTGIKEYYRALQPRPLTIVLQELAVDHARVACGTIESGSGAVKESVLIYVYFPETDTWRLAYLRPADGRANGYRFDVDGQSIRVLSPIPNREMTAFSNALVEKLSLSELKRRASAVRL